MAAPKISLLPARRVGDAVTVLTDAFRDDPIFAFHFPDPVLRAKIFALFFNDIVRAHLRFGHVYAAMDRERLVGTAVWRPLGAAGDTVRDRLRSFVTRRRLMALTPVAGSLMDGFGGLEATHPSFPHWYLFFIGIDSIWRGQGLGARLMGPVLEIADAAGIPCYLETPFAQTLAFYRSLGYEVTSEPRPFPGAPQLWAMTRTPKA